MLILTNVNMNKNEIQNVVIQNLTADPANGVAGQIYFNTTDRVLKQFNGTVWEVVGKELTIATSSVLGGIKSSDDIIVDGTTGVATLNKAIDDLQNYYLKTETYTQEEVDALIAGLDLIEITVVETLPTTGEKNKFYFVPKTTNETQNVYDEYIWTGSAFEHIGDTQVDLTNYGKCFTGTITSGQTSTAVTFTGTFSSAACLDATTGELLLCEVTVTGTTATFEIASAYAHNITCNVIAKQ